MEEEREIDLGQYIRALWRYWYLPLGVMLTGLLIVVLATVIFPRGYVARVLVLSTERALGTQDAKTRATTLQELVASPIVARAVLDKLGLQIPAAERSPEALLRLVSGRILAGSNLLQIIVTHPDPQVALPLADAWALEYVSYAEEVLKSTSALQHEAIMAQLPLSEGAYDRTQATWEALLRQDRYAELSRRLAERETMLQILSNASSTAVAELLADMQHYERLLSDARDLRAHLQAGGSPASSAATLTLLQSQVLASLGPPTGVAVTVQPREHIADPAGASAGQAQTVPGQGSLSSPLALQLQASPADLSATQMTSELELLVTTLESRLAALQQEWATIARSVRQNDAAIEIPSFLRGANEGQKGASSLSMDTRRALEEQVRALRAELAQEESRLETARLQRDLARDSYESLLRQEAEVALALQLAEERVRPAGPAQIVTQTLTEKLAGPALGALFGLGLGSLAAVLLDRRHRGLPGAMS